VNKDRDGVIWAFSINDVP